MQKISSYLYPNRIKCNLDLALSPLEWRIVYQKNVKLYKGLDNAVELDVRNNSQQRIDITGLTLNFKILDVYGQQIFDGEVNPLSTENLVTQKTYSSGGTSGSSTITFANVTDIVVGQIIVGTGVPKGTVVSSINTLTITLSKPLTAQALGTYSFYSTLTGLARVEIPADTFTYVEPQFLKYTVYQTIDGKNYPVYGDTQFGAVGTIDLLGGAVETNLPPIIIKTFLYMDNDAFPGNWPRDFFSEGALIKDPNYISENTTINVDFYPIGLNTTVHVQVTDAKVISTSTIWTDIDTVTVASNTTSLSTTYTRGVTPNYTDDTVWLRVKYQLPYNATGKFDKIIIRR